MRIKAVFLGTLISGLTPAAWSNDSNLDIDSLIDLSLSELQTIQVDSASKISQSLNSIPASVSIITRSDIENYGYTSLTQLLRNVPGIYLEEDTEEIFIGTRGSIGGSVQVLVNGIPQHPFLQKSLTTVETNRLNISIAAIDRVEFIRGPMSVIYGNNAFQGTLNIITHQSEKSLLRLAAGEKNNGELFARIHHPFSEGKLNINLGISHEGSFAGDYRDQLGTDQLTSLNEFTQTTAEDNLQKTLKSIDVYGQWRNWEASFSYQNSRYPFYPSVPPTDENTLELQTWLGSLRYQQTFREHWQSTTTLIVSRDEYNLDNVHIINDDTFGFQNQQSQRFDFEQVFAYQIQDECNFLFGYRLQQIDEVENRAIVQLGGDTIAFVNSDLDSYRQHEVFSQFQYTFQNGWSLVMGMRYSQLPKRYDISNTSPLNVTSNDPNEIDDRDLLNYRVALLYDLNDYHQFKLLHGTASQDNESRIFSDPESIRTTELVHQYDNEHWLLSHSVYYSTTRNILRRDVRFSNQTNMLETTSNNDGRWRSYGYDFNIDYRPTPQWRLSASFNLQTTRDQSVDDNIGYSPNQLLKLKTDFKHGKNTYALYSHFVGQRDTELEPTDTNGDDVVDSLARRGEPADGYWNIGVNWRRELHHSTAINLNISNLLDEEFRYPANEVSDLDRGLIGVGRVVTLSLETHW